MPKYSERSGPHSDERKIYRAYSSYSYKKILYCMLINSFCLMNKTQTYNYTCNLELVSSPAPNLLIQNTHIKNCFHVVCAVKTQNVIFKCWPSSQWKLQHCSEMLLYSLVIAYLGLLTKLTKNNSTTTIYLFFIFGDLIFFPEIFQHLQNLL